MHCARCPKVKYDGFHCHKETNPGYSKVLQQGGEYNIKAFVTPWLNTFKKANMLLSLPLCSVVRGFAGSLWLFSFCGLIMTFKNFKQSSSEMCLFKFKFKLCHCCVFVYFHQSSFACSFFYSGRKVLVGNSALPVFDTEEVAFWVMLSDQMSIKE